MPRQVTQVEYDLLFNKIMQKKFLELLMGQEQMGHEDLIFWQWLLNRITAKQVITPAVRKNCLDILKQKRRECVMISGR